MEKEIKIINKEKFNEIKKINEKKYGKKYKPATYTSNFINTCNGHAQSTRPKTVGALAAEIFPEFLSQEIEHNQENWESYYMDNYKERYDDAFEKLKSKVAQEREAIQKINDEDIKEWLNDLMFNKTFNGLYVQDAILEDIAGGKENYTRASKEEESQGIDGYIGGEAYSVKPESYKNTNKEKFEKISEKANMAFYRYRYAGKKEGKVKEIEYYIEEKKK